MSTVQQPVTPLVAGEEMSAEEFLRRWEASPRIKRAELIGGIVRMPSPLSLEHGEMDTAMGTWLGVYAAATPGCRAGSNATWRMLADVPQPDVHLRILPEYGGQSQVEGRFASGAPELAVEVCLTSSSYDLHEKKDLYRAAGVIEYIAVLVDEKEVRWHRLVSQAYQVVPAAAEGIICSATFPGLWLNAPAMLEGNMPLVLATLNQGLGSPEHALFVSRLAAHCSR